MDWKHWVILVLALLAGYWLHGKYPGLLTKGTGGMVSA